MEIEAKTVPAADAASVADHDAKNDTEQFRGLRRVPDRLPAVALLILVVELGERATYFGLSGPFQNYINNPYAPGSDLPGALGKGQAVATALGNFFKFWAYASTVIGAIIADQYLGKYKAILSACSVYIVGLVILVTTATPSAITHGAGLGGLIAAMVTIGLGTGGIKANVTPMCAEQYQNSHPVLKTLKSGEQVIVDPDLTVQRLFMWFYWVVNIGALSPLITVNVEKHHSFWLAYLVPLIIILISATVFFLGRNKYVRVPPMGSAILDACRTVSIAIKEKGFYNARPSMLLERGHVDKYPIAQQERYTDAYVGDVQRGLKSCKMFLFFPFYFICWNQMWNNLISQAGQMALQGTPNDLLQNLDPIALCIFIPFLDVIVYPLLRKYKIDFDPVTRIFMGFMFASVAMVYACVLQHYIYNSPPQSIHVWIQAPSYVLVAFSEAFVIITGLELAFTQAPKNLRSVISALFWLTIAVAAAICIALGAVSQDPYLVWMYGSLAIVGFVAGCLFYVCFFPGRRKWAPREEVATYAMKLHTTHGVAVAMVSLLALPHALAAGDRLEGYGLDTFDPLCAYSCQRAVPTKVDCPEFANMSAKEKKAAKPSAKCLAAHEAYLTSIAWCINSRCDNDTLPSAIQKFWETSIVRNQNQAGVVLKFATYFEALSRVNTTVAPLPQSKNQSYELTRYIANRAGDLAFANLPLVFLYGGRNNPLLWLSNWSYATYLLAHRWIATILALQVALHSAMWLQIQVKRQAYATSLAKPYWRWGIVGTMAMCLLIPFSILPIRRRWYEIFLVGHIILAIVAIVGAYWHIVHAYQHRFGFDLLIYSTMGIWAFDRFVRISRASKNGIKRAYVSRVDDEYIRVDVPRVEAHGYCFAYFPTLSWRPWENHPFSVINYTQDETDNGGTLSSRVQSDTEAPSSPDTATPSATFEKSAETRTKRVGYIATRNHIDGGISMFIRVQGGITQKLAQVAGIVQGIPVLVEGSYGLEGKTLLQGHDSKLAPSLEYPHILCIAGGAGISAVLPALSQCLNIYGMKGSAKLYWGLRSAQLVDAVQSSIVGPGGERASWGNIEAHISVGSRLNVREILERELSESLRGTTVVVCGPPAMCDEVRYSVAALARHVITRLFVSFREVDALPTMFKVARFALEPQAQTPLMTKGQPEVGNKRFADFDLGGKTFIVTGGARGLGLALAEALVEAGGRVYCLDRAEYPDDEWDAAQERVVPEWGGVLVYRQQDVLDTEHLRRTIESIADEHGQLDGVIAAAGILQITPAIDYTSDDAAKMLATNFTAVLETASAAAEMMFKYKCRGSICLIASMSGIIANKGMLSPVYNSSKAALIQLTRNLAMEWSRERDDGSPGIRVNSISPGHIRTPMVEQTFAQEPGLEALWTRENMMGRLARPEEFKGAALFLLSNASSFMTGSNVVIDGGHTAW
ncbi:putative PTR2-Di-and tripeptide permease [Purpureocillium lavendulum]|uniref:PTR2-Di-and tripeptide permease n=1 Tax=Purpureocillium lavendulum TaxID=1247861 RepID=A0AB34FQP8_9HYPO|nr:putative PTR2-Di-and tripeptide permease [Purpureocillium lavendulum]